MSLRCEDASHQASSIPSSVIRSMVIVAADESPFLPSVRPAPRWSHCTSVNVLSRPEPRVTPRIGGITGTTVQKKDDRIVPFLTSNRDPLFDPADPDVARFVDPIRGGDRVVPRVPGTQERQQGGDPLQARVGGRRLRALYLQRSGTEVQAGTPRNTVARPA
jgi:hypothetical protein